MKIYDAALETELQNPDLTRGKLEPARRVTVHHDAVPASVRYEVMADTITSDLRRLPPRPKLKKLPPKLPPRLPSKPPKRKQPAAMPPKS